MKTTNQLQDEIIEVFSMLDEWADRYGLIIEMGNELPTLDEKYKTQNNLIEGCQSKVWLHSEYRDGVITYRGDSNSVIVKGMMSLLFRVLSGQRPEDISNADLYFIKVLELEAHLFPTRYAGLLAIISRMRLYTFRFIDNN